MNSKEIIEGWSNVIHKKEFTEKLSEERLKICKTCDSFTKFQACSLCGCPIIAKTRSVNSVCPRGKWKVTVELNNKPVFVNTYNIPEYIIDENQNIKRKDG